MEIKNPHSQSLYNYGSKEKPDIFLRGGTLLNVYSGELLRMNVAIKGKRIFYVGPRSEIEGDKTKFIEVENKVIVPGYIEPHFHPWMLYNPISFGKEACRRGTTTLICDNLMFYLLMGVDLFEAFMNKLLHMPIKFFWSCRAMPQTPMEREKEIYSIDHLKRLLNHQAVQSLGEITRWPELIKGNPKIMKLINHTKSLKKRVDGHTAGAKYEDLNLISSSGVDSCHESIDGEGLLERLRLGFYLMLRESSLRQDLSKLIKTIVKEKVFKERIMLTTDGSAPEFYQRFGITDNLIKIALREGVDPVSAYKMVTINPAVYYGLDHEIGGIAPGRYADILILKDLLLPTPEIVISKGEIIAEDRDLKCSFPELNWKRFLPKSSFSQRKWQAKSQIFKISPGEKVLNFPTIKLISSVITRMEWVEFDVENGFINLNRKDGFSYCALINRDGRWVTNGILQGFGEVEGLASSFNTAIEILAIGRNPEAMNTAVNRVLEMRGGIVAYENGKILYEFPLPLGGIMSDLPMEKLAGKDKELQEFLSKRGYPFQDPLFTLLFLPNDFLPDVRINYRGIVDIKNNKILWPRRPIN